MNRFLLTLCLFIHLCGAFDLGAAIEKLEKISAAEQLLEQNENIQEKYSFAYRGKEFVGYPNVYSPVIFPGSSKQTAIVIRPGDHFLELGCGTGIFSVLAALNGAWLIDNTW